MRLRQPLNGFKLSKGHVVFHFAFLLSSCLTVNIPLNRIFELKMNQKDYIEDPVLLVNYSRLSSLIMVCAFLLERYLVENGEDIIG